MSRMVNIIDVYKTRRLYAERHSADIVWAN